MTTIKIDDKDYELEDMSDEAKNQLQSIRFVDQELMRLQAKGAALQTARIAYGRALTDALGTERQGDDLELELPDDISFD
jgi:hypothetical protein